jgi:hypothetical protein
MTTYRDQESELAVLKNVVNRIDNSIAAMTEVSANIGKLLAVHEERLNKLEKDNTTVGFDIRDIHSRINTMSKEILERLDSTEKSIEVKIKESNDQTNKRLTEITQDMKKVDDRVNFLEKWKWMLFGGALAAGWIIAKVPNLNLL